MAAVSFTPAGPFSLAASIRFLEGFTPASYEHTAEAVLRLAFVSDDGHTVVGAAVRQEETVDGAPGTVHAECTVHAAWAGPPGPPLLPVAGRAARAQIARILSLDVDATDFPALADKDEVVAGLQAEFPGLRPVLFHSPYEAAAWTIIGNRIRETQAAAVKARLAQEHGQAVDVAGRMGCTPFPPPPCCAPSTRSPASPASRSSACTHWPKPPWTGASTPRSCAHNPPSSPSPT